MKSRLPVARVILHGSAARGELTESSDIDLVFIGDFKERWLDRHRPISALVPDNLPVEFFCYTADEFQRGLACKNPFIREVARHGRELTGDEELELRHRGQDLLESLNRKPAARARRRSRKVRSRA